MASSLNTSLVTSPSRSRLSRSRGPSSADFLDQIRQLEMEGERLRRGSDPGSPSKYTMNGGISQLSTGAAPSVTHYYEPSSSYQPPSLATVTDITTDQRSITDLSCILIQAKEVSEEQRKQFRAHIEELKSKLQETVVNRDSIMDLRQREAESQENLIRKLQATLRQLQEAYSVQEKTLQETGSKTDKLSQNLYVADTSLNQIRAVIASVEKKRGKSFYDSEPIDKQSSTMVVHTLERCVQEMESDLETKAGKMKQLENDLEELQKSSRRTQDKLIVEHQQRLSQLTEEHERQLQAAADRAANAREQAANLQSQITLMQEQLDKQAQMKDDHIRELENKITSLKEDQDVAKKGWTEKREALELAVDQVQKELNVMRSEKQEAVQTAAAMETRIEDYQLQVEKLSDELDTDREQMKKLWQREDEANKKQIEMESRLHEKDKEIERLEMLMDSVKAECELTLKDRVASIEKDEKLKTAEQITTLTIQLQTLTEKSTRMTYEIETLQTENGNLKKQVTELTEKNQDARVKIETMEAEKTNLGALMEDRINDCQRLTQERDYYFGLLEERNQELKTLQAENEQLSTRLDEKERNFTALQRQSTDMSHAIELNSKSNDELKLERERLLKSIEERTIELEELKLAKSNITRKLKIREKRLKDIELDKNKLIEELQIKRQDIDAIIKEKDGLYQELKGSRYEVATLSEERDEIQKQKEEQKKQLEGELDRLTQKYVALQQEYRIAQKAIKTKEAVDGKAVKYADKMQKEVTAKRGEIDSLRSKVHWLEECLDAALKDKQALKQERKKLSSSLNNSSTQNEKLADQLEGYAKKNEDLKSKCDRLETALEKAAVKHAEAVAKLETMEQEMASMKLRHQLDIK
ncbi:coiled-coil domain-containing protein 158-like, partial [Lingula anatina]|uniref:Coiled-coil domain-containing protein 158-like n=1 Tax=Lingula anatina TaxID=7574 RepID=A0A2R2ML62_LINAN